MNSQVELKDKPVPKAQESVVRSSKEVPIPKSTGETSNMAGAGTGLAALVKDQKKLREVASAVASSMVLPGSMSRDEAAAYMASVANCFPSVSRDEVELALCVWCMLHGTGGTDDYTTKPPVVAGGVEVKAVEIFGKIIPVGIEGKPRQFASTMFESQVHDVLAAMPELQNALAPRLAKVGLKPGDASKVIDFVKGNVSATAGGGGDRARAKAVLLRSRSGAGGIPAWKVAESQVEDLGPVAPPTQHMW